MAKWYIEVETDDADGVTPFDVVDAAYHVPGVIGAVQVDLLYGLMEPVESTRQTYDSVNDDDDEPLVRVPVLPRDDRRDVLAYAVKASAPQPLPDNPVPGYVDGRYAVPVVGQRYRMRHYHAGWDVLDQGVVHVTAVWSAFAGTTTFAYDGVNDGKPVRTTANVAGFDWYRTFTPVPE